MSTVTLQNYHPLPDLVRAYYTHNRKALGSTQKELLAAENFNIGHRQGLVEGIQASLTEMRRERILTKLNNKIDDKEYFSEVESNRIFQVLREGQEPWDVLTATISSTPTKEGREAVRKDFNEFFEELVQKVTSLAWSDEEEEYYEGRRRNLIKSGVMEPTADDAKWLIEEAEAMEAIANPMRKLADKAKGNG